MNETSADEKIVQEITINAPAERIFAALTKPDQRPQWWGAEGRFQATDMESDLRPGGKWIMRGKGVGGKAFQVGGEYVSIEPPRLLAFTWLATWDPSGKESLVRFDLEEKDGVTTVRLTHSRLSIESIRTHKGWPDILEWLRAYVEAHT